MADSFTGGTVLQGGSLTLAAGASLGAGGLALGDGTTFSYSANFTGLAITAPLGTATLATTAALGGNGYFGVISGGDAASRLALAGQLSFRGGGKTTKRGDLFRAP